MNPEENRSNSPNDLETATSEIVDALDDADFSHDDRRRKFMPENAIFPLAVLAYFIIGNIWGIWNTIWVIFIVAWAASEIIHFARTGKFKISIYGVALIVFIALNVFTDIRHTWLVFIAAWAIDDMFVEEKRKKKKR